MPMVLLGSIQFGNYVNPFKAVGIVVVLLIWARLLTWIDKDAPSAHLPREIINLGLFGGLIAGYLMFFLLSGFGPALGVLLGFFVLDIGAYLGLRAYRIGLGDLTGQLADWWHGLFKSDKVRKVKEVAGQVLIMDKGGVGQEIPAGDSPERLQYDGAQILLTAPMQFEAEKADLTNGEPPAFYYWVDGVRYDGPAMDSNQAGAAIQYLKAIAGLDMMERRKPQTGIFKAQLDKQKRTIQITTFGSSSGESCKLIFDPASRLTVKLDQLGFDEHQLQEVSSVIQNGEGGVVLLSAPKGAGLTTLAFSVIMGHDAFLYHVHTVERTQERELEGITQNILGANATPAEEAKQVNWVVAQDPDVIMATQIDDQRSAKDLAGFATGKHRVYVCLRAGSTFDAIKQWRKLVGDDALALKNLRLVVAGRLLRKLCAACKVGYTPDPAQLKKLNMNPESVGTLYLARKEPMQDTKGNPVPCNFCKDLAFKGRVGVYEVLLVDDEMKKALEANSENQIKQVFRKQHGRLLQEVALAQVQAGNTSVEEVLRVLKGDSGSSSGGSSSGGAPSGGKPAPAGSKRPSSSPARGPKPAAG